METESAVPPAAEGAPPFVSLAELQDAHYRLSRRPRAARATNEFRAELRTFFRRARATGRRLDIIEERSAAQAMLDYWTVWLGPAPSSEDADIVFDATLAPYEAAPKGTDEEPRENPYLRIRDYLRRDELAARLAARLEKAPALALLGADGSGRHALAKDGIFPRLALNVPAESGAWRLLFVTLRREPFRDLARACTPPAEPDAEAFARRQGAWLRSDPARLRSLLDAGNGPALLVVERLEEPGAGAPGADLRRLAEGLAAALHPPGLHRLILVMDPANHEAAKRLPALGLLLESADIPPYTAAELRHAITEPAARAGVKVDDAVVERLLHDVLGDPAAVVLLQFALAQLWDDPERRTSRRITAQAYDASGGAQLAFEKIAEALFLGLDAKGQKIVQRIFLQLVAADVLPNRVVGRSLSREDLQQQLGAFEADELENVLAALAAKYLVRSRDGKHLEPSNERLLTRWPRLLQWLNATGRERSERERLTLDAHQWEERGGDRSLLWSGARLESAWKELRGEGLTVLELRFLEAGRDAEDAERARRQKVKMFYLATIAGGALLALAALFISVVVGENRRATAMVIGEGVKRLEAGEPAAAAVLFDAAIQSELPLIGDDEIDRTRLAAALRQMPRLLARLPHLSIGRPEFHPRDPHLVVTTGGDRDGERNFAAFWNLHNNRTLKLTIGAARDLDNANAAAFSPASTQSEELIATAHGQRGGAGEVRLWSLPDALSGRATLREAWPARARVMHLAFSPQGTELAFALEYPNGDAEVCVRAPGVPETLAVRHFDRKVNHIAFDPAGEQLVIACGNPEHPNGGEAVLWEWREDRARSLRHAAPVNYAEFSPEDGAQLITASGADNLAGEARLWEVRTGMPAALPPFAHRDNVVFASFSPDGERVATAGRDNTARIWSRVHGYQTAELPHNAWVYEARFSPDGRHLVTCSRDRRARVWDAATGAPALPALNHSGSVLHAAFSADGRHVLAAGQDEARLWRLETRDREAPALPTAGSVQLAAFSRDTTLVATATPPAESSTVELWRNDGTRVGPPRKFAGSVAALVFTAKDRRLVAAGWTAAAGGLVASWDLEKIAAPEVGHAPGTGLPLVVGWDLEKADAPRVRQFDRPVTVAASPHGAAPLLLVVVQGSEADRVVLWNLDTDELRTIDAPGPVLCAVFAPDDETFAIAGGSRTARTSFAQVFETATGRPRGETMRHLEPIVAMDFGRDGTLLATASTDDSARVWNARTGAARSERIRGVHTADVQAIAFSPDARFILTGSYDGTAACVQWEGWKDGDTAMTFRHRGAVNVVAFSPDGRCLLTAADDGTARVWHRETGNLIAMLRHGEEVRDARFADGAAAVATLALSRPLALGDWQVLASEQAGERRGALRSVLPRRRLEMRCWQLASQTEALAAMREDAVTLANAVVLPPARLTPLAPPVGELPLEAVRLKSQQGEPLVDDLEYHTGQAERCESDERWFAAAWHFGRAIELRRAGVEPSLTGELALLEQRQGNAFFELRRWREAEIAYGEALALVSPTDPDRSGELYVRRAQTRTELGEFAGATEDCHEIAKIWPHNHDAWTLLARVDLEQDQPDKLRASLRTGIERERTSMAPWQRLAAAELWYGGGDKTRYREVCVEFFSRFKDVKGGGSRLAWPCLLALDSGVDPAALVPLVEESLQNRDHDYFRLNTYGAALLRAGRIDEAIAVLDRSRAAYIKARGSELQRELAAGGASIAIADGRPQDWVLLALAWSRKGDRQAAQHWLRKVELALELGAGGDPHTPRTIWTRLELEMLRREAAEAIAKLPAEARPTPATL
ncbi:MAG: hypothetical protein QOE70_1250 [Chthoniobacter sp.]|jgi:WD40 repeat protein/tetratricopeptide (TPR) repeat protein|nr:hypothetical protein [Chthoniobacter sp.]